MLEDENGPAWPSGDTTMKPNAQIHRTIVRILQQAGYAVAKGDAQRVQDALGANPIKTGRILEIATRLNMAKLAPQKPRRLVQEQAWRSLAKALPERITARELGSMRDGFGRYLGRVLSATNPPGMTMSDGHLAGCARLRDLVAQEDSMIPLYEVLCFERHSGIVFDAYLGIADAAKGCLRDVFREHADDLVNALPDEEIDAIANLPSFADALLAIDPYLYDGGLETGPFVCTLRLGFDLPTVAFFDQHVPAGAALYRSLAKPEQKVA